VPPTGPGALTARALDGDRRALAKLISLAEVGGAEATEVGALLFGRTGRAFTVGITGAPGAGKSTLTGALVGCMRRDGIEVAVLAVDPSSPFSGGAILGDRLRMQDHTTDPGVYIRSMASRGHLGGLALATRQAVRVLDATGAPWILVETVGVGQAEVEIADAADTTVVVVNPGWGDSVQANKAGLLEIADVLVVNKADRDGTAETVRDLEMMLDLSGERDWRPPVIETVASTGAGVDALWRALLDHRRHLEGTGQLERRRAQRLRDELRVILEERIRVEVADRCRGERFEKLVDLMVRRERDPYSVAEELLAGRPASGRPASGRP